MSAFAFVRLFALFGALVSSVAAAPIIDARNSIAKRSTFAAPAPHFTIYNDKRSSRLSPSSPGTMSCPADQAIAWIDTSAADQAALLDSYHAAGISLVVSAFGSTDVPTSSKADPTATANSLAAWVKANGLDGVDIDYEDLNAFDAGDGSAEQWLITFITVLRAALPSGQYLISQAPLAPWFADVSKWPGGGMLLVDQKVGSLLDFYNVQFYNQGATEYTTCAGLLTASSFTWPNTALFQIIAAGVDSAKLLIGKPGTAADATNGYIDMTTLAGCVSQAVGQGWKGGVMAWQFPDVGSAWIEAVRGTAFPMSSGGTSATTTKASSTSVASASTSVASASTSKVASTSVASASSTKVASTTTPPASSSASATSTSSSATASGTSSAGCSGVKAWSATNVYTVGMTATYSGNLWTAQWWTEDNTPGDTSGSWVKGATC